MWQNFSFFEGTVGLLHCPHMNIVQFWTLCVKLSNTSFGLLELIHIANAIFWPIIRMFVTIIWGYFDDPSLFISCQSTSKKIIQHMTLTVIRTYCTHCSCNQKLLVMLPLINFSEQFSSNFEHSSHFYCQSLVSSNLYLILIFQNNNKFRIKHKFFQIQKHL